MSVLERIRAHSQPDQVRTIEVPEWGDEEGKPLVIHYTMVSLGDLAEAQEAAKGNSLRVEAEILCLKAQDEHGKKLFKRIDVLELLATADPLVLRRISSEMLMRKPPEDIAKN